MHEGIVIIFSFLFGTVSSESCSSFSLKKEYFHKRLVGHAIFETTGVHHHECVRECMSLSVCKSVDFYKPNSTCKLNDADSMSVNVSEFATKSEAFFSDISDWPSTMVDGCSSRPCAANQKCISTRESYFCRDIACDSSQPIDNGRIQLDASDKNKYLDLATIKCNRGYVPSHVEVKCEISGQWENATCVISTDCKEILDKIADAKSGVYDIELWNSMEHLTVYCDMETDGGGWTVSLVRYEEKVFQKRFDGLLDFYRNFTEYENGFGNADGEFWIGLRFIQELAEQGPTELRIDMTSADDVTGYETFQNFSLAGSDYQLNIGSRNSTIGDAVKGLLFNNGYPFTTFDRDMDSRATANCAVQRHGAWWYHDCAWVNLNGYYSTPPGTYCNLSSQISHSTAEQGLCGLIHVGFMGDLKSLKTSTMMLRRI